MASVGDFCADSELSEIISKLWEMDDNKCYPGRDYELNLQGYVTSTRREDDYANQPMFSWFDDSETGVFSYPTYNELKSYVK